MMAQKLANIFYCQSEQLADLKCGYHKQIKCLYDLKCSLMTQQINPTPTERRRVEQTIIRPPGRLKTLIFLIFHSIIA